MDGLYQSFHTYERWDEPEFDYLWDTEFFKNCEKGAGYYKHKLQKITYLPQDHTPLENPMSCLISTTPTHSRKDSLVFFDVPLVFDEETKKFKFKTNVKYLHTSVLDYFLTLESTNALWSRGIKKKKQYQHELAQIQAKYPAYFL